MRLGTADGACSGVLLAEPRDPNLPLLVCIHGGGCHGGYFSAAGDRSTVIMARERGFAVLLVDRPGYGASAVPDGAHPVRESLEPIATFIGDVFARQLPNGIGVALIGHSIGAAIALSLAARPRPFPLLAIAVSGIGDCPPAGSGPWPPLPLATKGSPPGLLSSDLFFGRPGSFDWNAVGRLRRVGEPWLLSEITEVMNHWPSRWQALAPAIDVPVHLRLAEHEAIWCTGDEAVARMAGAMTGSPVVDTALLPDGGHLYELHKRGDELVSAQLDFIAQHAQISPSLAHVQVD